MGSPSRTPARRVLRRATALLAMVLALVAARDWIIKYNDRNAAARRNDR